MAKTVSSPPADRARIRELESHLDLTQEELDAKVRELIEETDRVTAKIREELAALYEAKAKELRQRACHLRAANTAADRPASLAKSSTREAALEVLRGSAAPMHFSDIARAAIARGYGGGKLDSEGATVQTTFRRTLGKWPELFVRTGPGTYRQA